MRKRGRGPKHQPIRRYGRWVRGERQRVGDHMRGADPKPKLRKDERQLDFGF